MTNAVLKHIILTLCALLLTCVCAACTDEGPSSGNPGGEDSGLVMLSLDLRPMSTSSAVASDGHPLEPGIGDDDKIYDGKWLHVYVHDVLTENIMLHFDMAQSSTVAQTFIQYNEDGSCSLKFTTRALTPGREYRVSVMANCNDPSGNLYEVVSLFHNTSDSPSFLQRPHFIPMSGFRIFLLPEDIENKTTIHIGEVKLLRAASRIEILLTETMKKRWKIAGAVIEGAGNSLYSTSYASSEPEEIAKVRATEELAMNQMFRPRRGYIMTNPGGADIEMLDVDGNGQYFRLYLPEQENPVPSTGQELKIKLVMENLLTQQRIPAWLFVRDYSGDEAPLNLVRNHIYRFNVNAVKPYFDVEVDILRPSDKEVMVPPFN